MDEILPVDLSVGDVIHTLGSVYTVTGPVNVLGPRDADWCRAEFDCKCRGSRSRLSLPGRKPVRRAPRGGA